MDSISPSAAPSILVEDNAEFCLRIAFALKQGGVAGARSAAQPGPKNLTAVGIKPANSFVYRS
jgi:hypothetical protein